MQSFSQFRTFTHFRIIKIEGNLIFLNDSAGEFKILLEKVHSCHDISIYNLLCCIRLIESESSVQIMAKSAIFNFVKCAYGPY